MYNNIHDITIVISILNSRNRKCLYVCSISYHTTTSHTIQLAIICSLRQKFKGCFDDQVSKDFLRYDKIVLNNVNRCLNLKMESKVVLL